MTGTIYSTLTKAIAGMGIISTIFTVATIWGYLVWIGRPDLFIMAVSFKDVFSPAGIISIISFCLFCLFFFSPAIIGCTIIKHDKMNQGYFYPHSLLIKLHLLTTFIFVLSVIILALADIKPSGLKCISIISLCVFFIPTAALVKEHKQVFKHLKSFTVRKRWWIILTNYSFKPYLLGLSCCLIVFPLIVMTKAFSPDKNESPLMQATDLIAGCIIVIIFIMIPLTVYIHSSPDKRKWHAILRGTGAGLLSLIVVSLIHTALPAVILYNGLRFNGMNGTDSIKIAIKKESLPSETFTNQQWNYHLSKEGSFHLIDGEILFSYGPVVLVCPTGTDELFHESLKVKSFVISTSNASREVLTKATQHCVAVSREALNWSGID